MAFQCSYALSSREPPYRLIVNQFIKGNIIAFTTTDKNLDAFLWTIAQTPADFDTYLVFADYLEENGQIEAATNLRRCATQKFVLLGYIIKNRDFDYLDLAFSDRLSKYINQIVRVKLYGHPY